MTLEYFVQDLRYAFRSLRKSPGFSITVVVVLALAIGANTAIFSAVEGVVLEPLPFRDPDRSATRSGWLCARSTQPPP